MNFRKLGSFAITNEQKNIRNKNNGNEKKAVKFNDLYGFQKPLQRSLKETQMCFKKSLILCIEGEGTILLEKLKLKLLRAFENENYSINLKNFK